MHNSAAAPLWSAAGVAVARTQRPRDRIHLARKSVSSVPPSGFSELASLYLVEIGEPIPNRIGERTEGLTDPDDAPAAPEHPVSQTGDLWLLGAKVTCPKCRKATPLERAIRR